MTATTFTPRIVSEYTFVSFIMNDEQTGLQIGLTLDKAEGFLLGLRVSREFNSAQFRNLAIAHSTLVQKNDFGHFNHACFLMTERGPLTADQFLQIIQCKSHAVERDPVRSWDDWTTEIKKIAAVSSTNLPE
jgi:hypothetical protein